MRLREFMTTFVIVHSTCAEPADIQYLRRNTLDYPRPELTAIGQRPRRNQHTRVSILSVVAKTYREPPYVAV